MNNTTTNTPAESKALFQRLEKLLEYCGSANKHDRARALIAACIEDGIGTRRHIIGVLRHLGFTPQHIAIRLAEDAGSHPQRDYWQLGPDGRYRLHDEGPVGTRAAAA